MPQPVKPSPPVTPIGAMSAEAYIKERLEQYQGWYDGKAVTCKARYLRMRGASVVLG